MPLFKLLILALRETCASPNSIGECTVTMNLGSPLLVFWSMAVSGQACLPLLLQVRVRVVGNEEKGAHVVGSYARYTLQTLQQLWVVMCEVKLSGS